MTKEEAELILDETINTLTEIGEGASSIGVWKVRAKLFQFRDEWFKQDIDAYDEGVCDAWDHIQATYDLIKKEK